MAKSKTPAPPSNPIAGLSLGDIAAGVSGLTAVSSPQPPHFPVAEEPAQPQAPASQPGRPAASAKPRRKPSRPTEPETPRAAGALTRGCRPGYSRHTCLIPVEVIDNLRSIAAFFGRTESSVVTELLQSGIERVVEKHGKRCIGSGKQSAALL